MRKLFGNNVLRPSNTAVIVGFIVTFMVIFSLNLVAIPRVFGYGGTTSTTSSSSSTSVCGDARPASTPNLFQINASSTTAKLFFTPISNTNKYYISFSTKPSAEEHGTEVTLAKEGVQSYTVYHLKPNTTYYFKVRGQNGCMSGDWSNIMKITTRSSFLSKVVSFFKNSISKPVSILLQKIIKPAKQTQVTTPPVITPPLQTNPTLVPETETTTPPVVVPTPKKKCFLWWCW